MVTQRTDWAKVQVARVQAPVYASKKKKLARAKRRARFDGFAEYRVMRRILRSDAKALCFRIRMGWDD